MGSVLSAWPGTICPPRAVTDAAAEAEVGPLEAILPLVPSPWSMRAGLRGSLLMAPRPKAVRPDVDAVLAGGSDSIGVERVEGAGGGGRSVVSGCMALSPYAGMQRFGENLGTAQL